ncbi:OmpA family protein [Treponema denticola]|uniref:OmpA family protein n=1 Tax=Treponema denticola TaxID=158 RepID=UPI0020A2DCC0|nr:OmpA family protein [Treponema denticola]UTC84703.1 OmpA family protein [Treponema denticola]
MNKFLNKNTVLKSAKGLSGFFLFFFLFNLALNAYEPVLQSSSVQNWEKGTIESLIKLDMNKSGFYLPSDRDAAFNTIEKYMPSLLKDIYLSVIVDSSHRLGNYLAEEKVNLNTINKIIEKGNYKNPHFSNDMSNALIKTSTELHEIAKLFIKHNTPYVPSIPPSTTVSKAYTGILIDARGLLPVHGEYTKEKLQPCIFPKVWNTDMSTIYEKNMVDPKIAKKMGIVLYSSTLNEELYREYVGTEPLRIIARGVFGQNRTDPIISMEDSSRILSRPENLKLLQEGKVVIICDEDMLHVTEPFTPPDENYYFAYHDIELLLEKHKEKGITLSNPKNIVKIVMFGIRFVADMPDVLPEEMGKIDLIAEALLKLGPYTKFLIEGHTADLNRPEDEKILSVQRAERIADEISKRGIDRSRIMTAGYGSTRPVAPSNNETNMAKNRRVEITVIRE